MTEKMSNQVDTVKQGRFTELRPFASDVSEWSLSLTGAPAVLLPVRRLSDHGLKAWQEVVEHGYEGLMAKDPTSPYVGGRTLKWLKVKVPKVTARASGAGSRSGKSPAHSRSTSSPSTDDT
jgi:hypothetical protein